MVAPVTGPWVTTPTEPFADVYRVGWRQKPPFNTPLPLRFMRTYGKTYLDSDYYPSTPAWKAANFSARNAFNDSARYQACYNKAYERLKSKTSPSAGWAENIAQAGQARQMIVSRTTQLARFASAVAGRNFRHAAAILGHPEMSVGTSRRKKAAQNFLEYEYGLKPLLKDLEDSMALLTSDPGPRKVTGSASEFMWANVDTNSVDAYTHEVWQSRLKIKLGANFVVTNPNLFLANRLGLIDFALPWKLIPFSFIVDWFVNVEQVISSCSDWFGCALSNQYQTDVYVGMRRYVSFSTWQETPTWKPYVKYTTDQESFDVERKLGFPSPSLVIKPFQGFSLERGAQAVSLILSSLGR